MADQTAVWALATGGQASVSGDATTATGVPEVPEAAIALIRELMAVMPSNCSWLLPVRDNDGQVVDYRTMAASSASVDVAGRSREERIGSLLSERYPGLVGGPLWQLYGQVLHDGRSQTVPEFVYEATRHGVARRSVYDLAVHRLHGGLLVCWQRVDDTRRRMEQIELLGNLGWGEYDLVSGHTEWSPGMYRIFERDLAAGPLTRAEQYAAVLPEDQRLREAAWQTFDEGRSSDVVVRVRVGDKVKHLRVLADVDRDAQGKDVKIYGVVQDVTARESSRTQLEMATHELRQQERSLLAEHRVAAQLQDIILPLPMEPFDLGGLRVMVRYLPAERSSRVGGDWYLATTDDRGRAICGIGDVAGHGLPAATIMAQLRYALNGWIVTGTSEPADLMRHLNVLCLRLGTTASAVVTCFDADQGRLTWAQAGHPAPLHARAGLTTELERPPGMLLGATANAGYQAASASLTAGDLMLFYTDGLIERGADPQAERLRRVSDRLAAVSAASSSQPLAELQSVLRYANPDDDTCVLVMRLLTTPRS